MTVTSLVAVVSYTDRYNHWKWLGLRVFESTDEFACMRRYSCSNDGHARNWHWKGEIGENFEKLFFCFYHTLNQL